jgi:allene oxide cyclase
VAVRGHSGRLYALQSPPTTALDTPLPRRQREPRLRYRRLECITDEKGAVMRIRWIAATAAALAVSGGGLAIAAGGSPPHGVSAPLRLHIIEHNINEHLVDLPPKGDSQGDLFPFSNVLFNAADTRQIGRDQGNCVRTNPKRGEWQCSWTNKLGNGSITVEGPFYDTRDSYLAIIGGTGVYRDAHGQMLLHARSDGYDFVFSID